MHWLSNREFHDAIKLMKWASFKLIVEEGKGGNGGDGESCWLTAGGGTAFQSLMIELSPLTASFTLLIPVDDIHGYVILCH